MSTAHTHTDTHTPFLLSSPVARCVCACGSSKLSRQRRQQKRWINIKKEKIQTKMKSPRTKCQPFLNRCTDTKIWAKKTLNYNGMDILPRLRIRQRWKWYSEKMTQEERKKKENRERNRLYAHGDEACCMRVKESNDSLFGWRDDIGVDMQVHVYIIISKQYL